MNQQLQQLQQCAFSATGEYKCSVQPQQALAAAAKPRVLPPSQTATESFISAPFSYLPQLQLWPQQPRS